jgi:hypothetical protein
MLLAQAQSSLSLNWGPGYLKRQDLTFSPLIHDSWSPLNLMLEYRRSGKMEQSLQLRFGQYQPIIGEAFDYESFYEGNIATYPHSFMLIDLNYALARRVVDGENYQLSVGGRLHNRLLPSDYVFANFSSIGYYLSFGLDLWLQSRIELWERHYFDAQLAVPFLSWNARTDYLWHTDEYFGEIYSHNGFTTFGNFVKGGSLQSWDKAQRIDIDLEYGYRLSDKWDIGARYGLTTDFNQDPTRFSQVVHQFYFTGRLKF